MTFRAPFAALAVLALAAAEDPRYDTATVVDLRVVLAETREVPAAGPLAGVHLMVRPENARGNSELQDVYLGPAAFVNEFNFPLRPRDRLEVVGSKVKAGSASVVLAREVRHDSYTLYLRDRAGEPMWRLP
jgi:hypothetical protein